MIETDIGPTLKATTLSSQVQILTEFRRAPVICSRPSATCLLMRFMHCGLIAVGAIPSSAFGPGLSNCSAVNVELVGSVRLVLLPMSQCTQAYMQDERHSALEHLSTCDIFTCHWRLLTTAEPCTSFSGKPNARVLQLTARRLDELPIRGCCCACMKMLNEEGSPPGYTITSLLLRGPEEQQGSTTRFVPKSVTTMEMCSAASKGGRGIWDDRGGPAAQDGTGFIQQQSSPVPKVQCARFC